MILDHIGVVFNQALKPELVLFLRLLGRLSFPVFTYYVVLGINRTSNKKKYLCRMTGLAVISQIILEITFPPTKLNVLFGFSLYILHSIMSTGKNKILTTVFLIMLSTFTEYSYSGFLTFLAISFIYDSKLENKKSWSTLAIFMAFIPPVLLKETAQFQLLAALSGVVMFTPKYEGRLLSAKIERAVFYVYYPGQWILFYLLATILRGQP